MLQGCASMHARTRARVRACTCGAQLGGAAPELSGGRSQSDGQGRCGCCGGCAGTRACAQPVEQPLCQGQEDDEGENEEVPVTHRHK